MTDFRDSVYGINPDIVSTVTTRLGGIDNTLDSINSSLAEISTYKEINGALPFGTNLTAFKGDGSDESSTLLAFLNYVGTNHLSLYIPKGMTITVSHIAVSNLSNFGIVCDGTIKRINNCPTNNALLEFDNCSNFHIPIINFDGNGLNNGCVETTAYRTDATSQQYQSCITLSGCTYFEFGYVYAHNSGGDVLYITNTCMNFKVDTIIGKGDIQIGRNLVSIIDAQNGFFNNIYGDNFGHYDQPGGIDIEPNSSSNVVKNIQVNSFTHNGAGTNPLSILNTNGSTVQNIIVSKAILNRTHVAIIAPESNSAILAGTHVHIGKLIIINKTPSNAINGIKLDSFSSTAPNSDVTVDHAYIEGCYRGIYFNNATSIANGGVNNVRIKAVMRNIQFDGITFMAGSNVYLDVDIDSVSASRFMLNKPNGAILCDNVTITGNLSLRGSGLRAILMNDIQANVTNWKLINVDLSGWAVGSKVQGTGCYGITQKINCTNLTKGTSAPTQEYWNVGDYVENSSPSEQGTAGSKYIIRGWICSVSGNPGTWLPLRSLTGN